MNKRLEEIRQRVEAAKNSFNKVDFIEGYITDISSLLAHIKKLEMVVKLRGESLRNIITAANYTSIEDKHLTPNIEIYNLSNRLLVEIEGDGE